jgi:hypothetical protein
MAIKIIPGQGFMVNGFIRINEKTSIHEIDGHLILKTAIREIDVDNLLSRLEALETAYMEEKLIGKNDETK